MDCHKACKYSFCEVAESVGVSETEMRGSEPWVCVKE